MMCIVHKTIMHTTVKYRQTAIVRTTKNCTGLHPTTLQKHSHFLIVPYLLLLVSAISVPYLNIQ